MDLVVQTLVDALPKRNGDGLKRKTKLEDTIVSCASVFLFFLGTVGSPKPSYTSVCFCRFTSLFSSRENGLLFVSRVFKQRAGSIFIATTNPSQKLWNSLSLWERK